MSTSTRLILLLTTMVALVMAVAGYFNLRQRESALVTAMHNEVRAHARTLQIALENDYHAGRIADAQWLIDRLSENTRIYGVILFDEEGRISMVSDPLIADEIRHPPDVLQVVSTDDTIETVRHINDQQVFSITMPIQMGETRGAVEITQRMSYVKSDIARARRDIIVTTLLLFAAIIMVVFVVTRRNLSRPIRELLGGAAALGGGDLDYRVIVPKGGGEFARLAVEFNRMADSLVEQRRAAAREAEERLSLERELRHSERLATIGRVAAGVAHELGAPLNVIDGRAERLLTHPNVQLETRQRNLTIIRAQANRIKRIVRQLLNIVRPHDIRFAPVSAAQLINTTVELIEGEAKSAGISVEVASEESVRINADEGLLQQVLLNICFNAIQAMPSGGCLRIECLDGEMAEPERRFVGIRISDTGGGIAPESLSHIFEPFYTTKEAEGGTGLGLTISRRIVEQHGGWIEAANKDEGGAIFTIWLQRCEQESRNPVDGNVEERIDHHESAIAGN